MPICMKESTKQSRKRLTKRTEASTLSQAYFFSTKNSGRFQILGFGTVDRGAAQGSPHRIVLLGKREFTKKRRKKEITCCECEWRRMMERILYV